MMHCYCCERRAATTDCNCTAGTVCLNCKRCERHCGCPFDLREIVLEDDEDTAVEPTEIIHASM